MDDVQAGDRGADPRGAVTIAGGATRNDPADPRSALEAVRWSSNRNGTSFYVY